MFIQDDETKWRRDQQQMIKKEMYRGKKQKSLMAKSPRSADTKEGKRSLMHLLRREWAQSKSSGIVVSRRVRNAFNVRDKQRLECLKRFDFESALVESMNLRVSDRMWEQIADILGQDASGAVPFSLFLEAIDAFATELRQDSKRSTTGIGQPDNSMVREKSTGQTPSKVKRKLRQYARWVDGLINPQHRDPTYDGQALCDSLRTGVLLCQLVELLTQRRQAHKTFQLHGVTHKAFSKATCMKNIELALSHVWKQRVTAQQMPEAVQIYNGEPVAIANLLGQVSSALVLGFHGRYVNGPASLGAIFTWYNFVLQHYDRGLPDQLLNPPHRGLWAAFGGVDPLLCVLHFFNGSSHVNLANTFSFPIESAQVRHNADQLLQCLEHQGLPITLSTEDFIAARSTDQDMLLLLLVEIYERLRHAKCALPKAMPSPSSTQQPFILETKDSQGNTVHRVQGIRFKVTLHLEKNKGSSSPSQSVFVGASPFLAQSPHVNEINTAEMTDLLRSAFNNPRTYENVETANSPNAKKLSPELHLAKQKHLARKLGLDLTQEELEESAKISSEDLSSDVADPMQNIPSFDIAQEIAQYETRLMQVEEARSWSRMLSLPGAPVRRSVHVEPKKLAHELPGVDESVVEEAYEWFSTPRLFAMLERNSTTLCEFLMHRQPHDAVLSWAPVVASKAQDCQGFIRLTHVHSIRLERRKNIGAIMGSMPLLTDEQDQLILMINLHPGSFGSIQSAGGHKLLCLKAPGSNQADTMRLYAHLNNVHGLLAQVTSSSSKYEFPSSS